MNYEFSPDKLKIREIYRSASLDQYKNIPMKSEKIKAIYGDELKFQQEVKDRPIVFASYVESMDGKLAYADNSDAFYIARKNMLCGNGKDVDFWILNMLRGVCDAAVIGGNTLNIDSDYSMYCLDEEIVKDRIEAGYDKYPIQVITSLNCEEIDFEHKLLNQTQIPKILATSHQGLERIREKCRNFVDISANPEKFEELMHSDVLPVIITGSGGETDACELMKKLKRMGVDFLLIESPGYGHHLISKKLLDEIFFNFSCVYIGGHDTMTMGKAFKGFTSENHPHAQVLSIHAFNDYYFYFRYAMNYEGFDEGAL